MVLVPPRFIFCLTLVDRFWFSLCIHRILLLYKPKEKKMQIISIFSAKTLSRLPFMGRVPRNISIHLSFRHDTTDPDKYGTSTIIDLYGDYYPEDIAIWLLALLEIASLHLYILNLNIVTKKRRLKTSFCGVYKC